MEDESPKKRNIRPTEKSNLPDYYFVCVGSFGFGNALRRL